MVSLNFHHLLLFHAVARQQSLTRAAEELSVSQPSISVQLRGLERALGVELLERHPRGVRLTSAGQVVADYAGRIFGLAGELEAAVADLRGLRAGHLVLGASTTIGEYLLFDVVAEFRRRYAGVDIELRIANTSTILASLAGHSLDLGLVGEAVDEAHLVVEPFRTDRIVLIARPGHPLTGEPVDTAALADASFVARETGSATRRTGEQELARHGVRPRVVMELGSNEAVKRAVAAGLGLALISAAAIQAELRAGLLQVVTLRDWQCQRPLSIVYRRDRRLGKLEQAFLAILHDAANAADHS